MAALMHSLEGRLFGPLVSAVLRAGANPNSCDVQGDTPLSYACLSLDPACCEPNAPRSIVRILFHNRAYPYHAAPALDVALSRAQRHGNALLVRLIKEARAKDPPPLLDRRVRLRGLSARPELNAHTGLVVCFDESTGRYGVQLDSSREKQLALKPANLSPLYLDTATVLSAALAAQQPAAQQAVAEAAAEAAAAAAAAELSTGRVKPRPTDVKVPTRRALSPPPDHLVEQGGQGGQVGQVGQVGQAEAERGGGPHAGSLSIDECDSPTLEQQPTGTPLVREPSSPRLELQPESTPERRGMSAPTRSPLPTLHSQPAGALLPQSALGTGYRVQGTGYTLGGALLPQSLSDDAGGGGEHSRGGEEGSSGEGSSTREAESAAERTPQIAPKSTPKLLAEGDIEITCSAIEPRPDGVTAGGTSPKTMPKSSSAWASRQVPPWDHKALKEALEIGFDVDAPIGTTGQASCTLLGNAAYRCDCISIDLLMEHRASVDIQVEGKTALIHAVHGAGVALQGVAYPAAPDGGAPSAPCDSSAVAVRRLLNYAADPNLTCQRTGSSYCISPLLLATQLAAMPIVKVLLEHRAQPDLDNEFVPKPLIVACANRHEAIARLLRQTCEKYDLSQCSLPITGAPIATRPSPASSSRMAPSSSPQA